jgi:RNase P subunit RPR2
MAGGCELVLVAASGGRVRTRQSRAAGEAVMVPCADCVPFARAAESRAAGVGRDLCHSIIDGRILAQVRRELPRRERPGVTTFVDRALVFFAALSIATKHSQKWNA